MEKSAVIVCNGEPPSLKLINQLWGEVDLRICADGGANYVCSQGFTPDLIIGDMDSIDPSIAENFDQEKLIKIEEQETNDGDKALRYCLQKKIKIVHLIGASGGRIDQFLVNVELLYKFFPKLKITLWTNFERLEVIEKEWIRTLPVGTTISLLPLFGEAKGIVTKGLVYALNEQNLCLGKTPSGVSNCSNEPIINITIREGHLLVVIQSLV